MDSKINVTNSELVLLRLQLLDYNSRYLTNRNTIVESARFMEEYVLEARASDKPKGPDDCPKVGRCGEGVPPKKMPRNTSK